MIHKSIRGEVCDFIFITILLRGETYITEYIVFSCIEACITAYKKIHMDIVYSFNLDYCSQLSLFI